jgi:ketosteroid isomerase-like protein
MRIARFCVLAAAVLTVLVSIPKMAIAADTSAVTAEIQTAVVAFNQGNMKGWVAACASPAIIVDDFPPHAWQGPTACTDWWNAYVAFSKKHGVAGGMVTLGTPWHVTVSGNRAYAVYPVTFSYKQHGKPMKESGILTFAMQKTPTGWLVAGWAYSQH